MKLVYFNYSYKVIPMQREIHTLLPCIAFSKGPASYSSYFGAVINTVESEWLEKEVKALAEMLYAVLAKREGEKEARHAYDTLMRVHKARQKKMPTQADLKLRTAGRGLIASSLDLVRTHYRDMLVAHEMHRINSFRRDELLKYYFKNIGDNVKDDLNETAVSEFMDVVSEDLFAAIPVCTEQLVMPFDVADMEQSLSAGWYANGMLKLPLFELPGFLQFKRKKYELIREELKPGLEAWWSAMEHVTPAVAGVPFSTDGLPELKNKIMNMLVPAAESLSKQMKSSIYLQQLYNDEGGEYGSSFSFVMTRRMTLLEAFHKAGQMPDGALQKLREYFTARNTADNTVCFLLHELPVYPPKKEYFEKDEKWLDETWQESMKE